MVGFVLALPLFYLVSASLMTESRLTTYPPALLPDRVRLDNYSQAFSYLSTRTIINSIAFTLAVVFLQWGLTIAAGFAVAKLQFRGRNVLTAVFSLCLFIPFITLLVPTFVVVNKLHLTNTYLGLILPVVAQVHFGTLLFRQYITNLPDELIAAARVDGAGWARVFTSIIIPLARPATGAYASISTLTAWNMYLWPLIVTTDPKLQVLPLALAPLAGGQYAIVPEPVALAATVIATVPMILAFLVAQRSFVRGLVGTGLD